MNINTFKSAIDTTNQKMKQIDHNNRFKNFDKFVFIGEDFVTLFEGLKPTERSALILCQKYTDLITIYDRLRGGGSFRDIEANTLKKIIADISYLNGALVKSGLKLENRPLLSSLVITFPLQTFEDSPLAFAHETQWFFEGLKSGLPAFKDISDDFKVTSLSNEWLQITVNIDWRFVIVVYLIWREFERRIIGKRDSDKLISDLEKRGVSEENIDAIRDDLELKEDGSELTSIIDSVEKKFPSIESMSLADDWKRLLRGVVKKLGEAMDKGYRIEAVIPESEPDLINNLKPEKIESVKKLILYDRDLDDIDFLKNLPKLENRNSL